MAAADFYDFVEIDTSDFDTLIQTATASTIGLSIDPLKMYLDRLPNPPHCSKINAAISNRTGEAIIKPKGLDLAEIFSTHTIPVLKLSNVHLFPEDRYGGARCSHHQELFCRNHPQPLSAPHRV